MITMERYVFDLDNTLIYTDLLNNRSYNYALNHHGLMAINDYKRITRDIVFKKYLNLNDVQKNRIIELKQDYFINNLQSTIPNTPLLKVLKSHKIQFCILWTSANKIRVKALLEYYNIYNAFKHILFSNKINVPRDVVRICGFLRCNPGHLVFYENNCEVISGLQRLNLNVIPLSSNEYQEKYSAKDE